MITWAIVPVKPLVRAKSRLADVLTPPERENLSLKILTRTLQLLKECDAITDTLVISRDTRVLAMARDLDVHTVQESGQPELNDALSRATSLLQTWGVEATLVLPADIPLLATEDIEEIVNMGRYRGSVVIAPDFDNDGTNALLMHPPGIIPYNYGNGSFPRHKASAKEAGAILHLYEHDRVKLDVDTPDNLNHYQMMAARLGEEAIDYTQPLEEHDLFDDPIPNGGPNG